MLQRIFARGSPAGFRRLNTWPTALQIYASNPQTENARTCRGQGLSAVLGAEPHRMSVSFGPLCRTRFPRAGKDSPGFSAGLADVDPARPERKKAVNLLIAVRGAAGEVQMQCHLDHHREQPSPCLCKISA